MRGRAALATALLLGGCDGPPTGDGEPVDQIVAGPPATIAAIERVARRCRVDPLDPHRGPVAIRRLDRNVFTLAFAARSEASRACLARWRRAGWTRTHPVAARWHELVG